MAWIFGAHGGVHFDIFHAKSRKSCFGVIFLNYLPGLFLERAVFFTLNRENVVLAWFFGKLSRSWTGNIHAKLQKTSFSVENFVFFDTKAR
ncbi:MAG: hypothetical protein IJO82_07065 [Clostridia bacterium]|nr:hypothetical protein [Clostridia bacterium]